MRLLTQTTEAEGARSGSPTALVPASPHTSQRNPLRVPCTHCGAAVGTHCVRARRGRGTTVTAPHEARVRFLADSHAG